MNTVDSIKKYGLESNILLLISPVPSLRESMNGYADYFACKDFITQTKDNQKKYIIFIGELGQTDGTEGMYSYLMVNPFLHLKIRETIVTTEKNGFTGVKQVFIFEIIKNKNCNYCGKINAVNKCKCGVYYCDRTCQRNDYRTHKPICDEKDRKNKNIKLTQRKIQLGISVTSEELRNLREYLTSTGQLNVDIDGRRKTRRKKSSRRRKSSRIKSSRRRKLSRRKSIKRKSSRRRSF
jgi:hypothetical protein